MTRRDGLRGAAWRDAGRGVALRDAGRRGVRHGVSACLAWRCATRRCGGSSVWPAPLTRARAAAAAGDKEHAGRVPRVRAPVLHEARVRARADMHSPYGPPIRHTHARAPICVPLMGLPLDICISRMRRYNVTEVSLVCELLISKKDPFVSWVRACETHMHFPCGPPPFDICKPVSECRRRCPPRCSTRSLVRRTHARTRARTLAHSALTYARARGVTHTRACVRAGGGGVRRSHRSRVISLSLSLSRARSAQGEPPRVPGGARQVPGRELRARDDRHAHRALPHEPPRLRGARHRGVRALYACMRVLYGLPIRRMHFLYGRPIRHMHFLYGRPFSMCAPVCVTHMRFLYGRIRHMQTAGALVTECIRICISCMGAHSTYANPHASRRYFSFLKATRRIIAVRVSSAVPLKKEQQVCWPAPACALRTDMRGELDICICPLVRMHAVCCCGPCRCCLHGILVRPGVCWPFARQRCLPKRLCC